MRKRKKEEQSKDYKTLKWNFAFVKNNNNKIISKTKK